MFRAAPLNDESIEAVCLSGRPLPMKFAQKVLETQRPKKVIMLTSKPPKYTRPLARPATMASMEQSLAKIDKVKQKDLATYYIARLEELGREDLKVEAAILEAEEAVDNMMGEEAAAERVATAVRTPARLVDDSDDVVYYQPRPRAQRRRPPTPPSIPADRSRDDDLEDYMDLERG